MFDFPALGELPEKVSDFLKRADSMIANIAAQQQETNARLQRLEAAIFQLTAEKQGERHAARNCHQAGE